MARPKVFHGSCVGIKLPKDVDSILRAAAKETGKSLSDLVRESLAQTCGKGHGMRTGDTKSK